MRARLDRRRNKSRIALNLHVLSRVPFNPLEVLLVLTGHECNRITAGSGSAGSPDTVDIVFGLMGDIVVDHMRNAVHVESPGRNIRGHEHPDGTAFETFQRAITLALRAVGMDRCCANALLIQAPRDLVGAMLGAREDEHAFHLLAFERMEQQSRFGLLSDSIEMLFDGFHRIASLPDFDGLRIAKDLCRKRGDLVRHRGREEHRLPVGRQRCNDGADVVYEPHVQHPVGFIQHEHLNRAEIDGAPLEVVQQAARSGNHHVDAPADECELFVHIHAAVDSDCVELHKPSVRFHRSMDLLREFTGGCQDERPRASLALCLSLTLRKRVQEREHKGSGLPGASLCQADNVASFQSRADCE